MEKVVRDKKVAILYSPRYGAGWYTWNTDHPQCLFHPKIVELVENNQRNLITDEFMQELLGIEYFYSGGSRDLQIKWLEEGTHFDIDEYDGFESITTYDNIKLIA